MFDMGFFAKLQGGGMAEDRRVECRIPVGAIDPDTIEGLEDLNAAIAAFDAGNCEYSDHVHVAEWEECEW